MMKPLNLTIEGLLSFLGSRRSTPFTVPFLHHPNLISNAPVVIASPSTSARRVAISPFEPNRGLTLGPRPLTEEV